MCKQMERQGSSLVERASAHAFFETRRSSASFDRPSQRQVPSKEFDIKEFEPFGELDSA